MARVVASLLLALGQLADPRIVRILVKSLAVTLALFAALAWGGWRLAEWTLERAGLADTLFAGAGNLRELAALLLALAGLWLVWRIVAMAVIQFFADEVVAAIEARHYPHMAGQAREPPLREQTAASLRAAGRALAINLVALPFALALLVTGFGTALLFWLVNALLLGRELQDMVWLRHRRPTAAITPEVGPLGQAERFVLGGAVAALLALPFVNFLAPVLGAAGATHLIHRKTSQARQNTL